MKILHIVQAIGVSGAERYIMQLLPGLKKDHGLDCHLIIVCPDVVNVAIDEFKEEMSKAGIPTTVIVAHWANFLGVAKKLTNYCAANEINVVHSHLINADLIAALAKRFFNRSLFLVSTKNGYQELVLQEYNPSKPVVKKNLYHLVTKMVLRMFDNNIAVSKGIANLFVNLELTRDNFSVIHHGINVEPIDKETAVSNFKKAPLQLVIVGRLEPFKGHTYLITAMKEVSKLFPDSKLLILGDGSLGHALKKQVDLAGLSQNVEFLGFQKNPYPYIAASDVVVLPSLFEPFGLVYIEAFALKVPVVAFDTPAGNEIIRNGETGLLGPRADSARLADNIISLLKNSNERARLSSNAYEEYKKRFTTETMISNTAAWYQSNLPRL